MILYVVVTLLTVALGLLVSREKVTSYDNITKQQLLNKICLAAIFCILFLLCALRVGVGNDYITYIQNAHEINVGGVIVTEWGYNMVVKALYTLAGTENYLLIFGLFGFMTIFIFLKAMYEQSESFAISFMLFMSLGIYFRSFNTVRYYFVLAITLYALRYVVNKEYVKALILILPAALFHKSVLIVIPLYFICNRPWKKWFMALVGVGTVGLYVLKDFVMDIALRLYPSYRDTIYLTADVGLKENLPSIARCLLVIALCIYCYKEAIKDNDANTFYFNMNITAVAIYLGGSFLPLVSRFGYYLITAQVLLIPGVISKLSGKKKKIVLIGTVCFAVLYFLYFLKTASNSGIAVLPYRSWLFDGVKWNNVEEVLTYTGR